MKKAKSQFEDLGFYKEYYIGSKIIGTLKSEKDRDVIGWCGKKTEIIESELILDFNKKIKAGATVQTILYPLCGKSIK